MKDFDLNKFAVVYLLNRQIIDRINTNESEAYHS